MNEEELDQEAVAGVPDKFVALVEPMVRESGPPSEPFVGRTWIRTWLGHSHPTVSGRKPRELLGTQEGRALIHNLLRSQQSVTYW